MYFGAMNDLIIKNELETVTYTFSIKGASQTVESFTITKEEELQAEYIVTTSVKEKQRIKSEIAKLKYL